MHPKYKLCIFLLVRSYTKTASYFSSWTAAAPSFSLCNDIQHFLVSYSARLYYLNGQCAVCLISTKLDPHVKHTRWNKSWDISLHGREISTTFVAVRFRCYHTYFSRECRAWKDINVYMRKLLLNVHNWKIPLPKVPLSLSLNSFSAIYHVAYFESDIHPVLSKYIAL